MLQVGCICTDTCLQWDKVVANRLGSCHDGKYKLLCGHRGRPCFSSAWRTYVIFQSCRGCSGICLPNWFLCQVQCSRWEPGDRWDGSLSDFYSGSSAGCLWFPDGVCLQLLFLWLPGGTEKINEMAEHSKPSFRLRLLGGFGSQIGCLLCFCGSQKGQWRWMTWQSAL